MKYYTLPLIALMALLILPGCGKSLEEKAAEMYVESVTGAEVDIDDERVMISGEDGGVVFTNEAEVPETYPNEVPYYDATVVYGGMVSLEGMGYITHTLELESKDSPEDIVAFYIEELTNKGWSKALEINDAEEKQWTLSFRKGGMDQVSISLTEEDGMTMIHHVVMTAE